MSQDYRLLCGVDVGGTFTDLVLIDLGAGRIWTEKTPTTIEDPTNAIVEGLTALRAKMAPELLGLEVRLVHATTLVTNTLIERKGARVALLTTEGFEDVLDFRRENRFDIFDLAIKFPEPLVPRELRWGIPERVGAEGEEIRVLDADAVRQAALNMRGQEIEAVAIAFLHAYENPAHEREAAELLRSAWPSLRICLSGEVAPLIREYERTCTTTVNAYVMPMVNDYLAQLAERVAKVWPGLNLGLMVSNGGICSPETARRFPVRLLESGPVAGALVAAHFGRIAGFTDVLAFDMGGTTAKLCVIRNGAPNIVAEFEADRTSRFKRGSGIPILVPSVDLVEIGAGGGSIASIDGLGLLQVGPRSASAKPGPACYGRSGTEATVTDADLILGYLNPDYFLGGKMPLDRPAAASAMKCHVGNPLNLDEERAAWGVHDLVNENMANAAWLHMAEKGLDPRSFTLVATGGAGPIHACHLAMKLGIGHVICPPASGMASAIGLLVAPPRADISHSFLSPLATLGFDQLNLLLDRLEAQARAVLIEAGIASASIRYARVAEMLYRGQTHQIEVPLPESVIQAAHGEALAQAFHDAYFSLYGTSLPDMPVEVAAVRVTAFTEAARMPGDLFTKSVAGPEAVIERPAYLASEHRLSPVPVRRRDAIIAGERFHGPAVIESPDTTILVEAGWRYWNDAAGVLHLEKAPVAPGSSEFAVEGTHGRA